jgi:hypothetical protein
VSRWRGYIDARRRLYGRQTRGRLRVLARGPLSAGTRGHLVVAVGRRRGLVVLHLPVDSVQYTTVHKAM